MRKCICMIAGCAVLLFAVAAIAQTSGSSGQYGTQSSTPPSTTTDTQDKTMGSSGTMGSSSSMGTDSGNSQTVEGCLVREQIDYFLIPRSGNPIRLENSAGQSLREHEGHKVKITGNQMASGSSSGMSAGSSGTATGAYKRDDQSGTSQSGAMSSRTGDADSSSTASGMAAGAGNDLHHASDRSMSIVKIQHVSAECQPSWNQKQPSSGNTGANPNY